MYGEQLEPSLDEKKLSKAIKKKKKKSNLVDRKRKVKILSTYEVSQEEMETYKMTKGKTEDPMAKVDSHDILPLE